MDYFKLAKDFLYYTHKCQNHCHQKKINEIMQGEAFVLLYLLDRGDCAMPREISEEMNISSARVAVILNNLENKGFIEREIDKSDRRRILVDLTEDGLELAKKHDGVVVDMTMQMLKMLGYEDAKELVRITKELAEIIPKIVPKITYAFESSHGK